MNTNSKIRSIKLICYVLFMLFFIIYLLLANQIVYASQSEETDLKVYNSFANLQFTSNGYCGIEASEYFGGDMEDFRLYGWAYAEQGATQHPFVNKETYAVLRDGKGTCYSARAVVTIRPDIYYAQKELGRNPISGNVGFEARMSTLLLPDGEYELYFYIYENAEVMSLVDTSYMLCKTATNVCVVER